LAAQPVDADDFPQVPVPGRKPDLEAAAAIGRQIAALNDPTVDVGGVTSGPIDPALAAIGVPDNVGGGVSLDFGRFGQSGGQRRGSDVLWSGQQGWRNVPDDVWDFTACGHVVLPKWLSYRVGAPLGSRDRQAFMLLCRRVAAIRGLEAGCDAALAAAEAAPLTA
jgi:hypothetical protein